ncbi:adenylate/guanylate cyclase domain-containing protein [Curvivirga aplysinae]|uniref:adenylate/guanylate cyclase domain-containing protein n=1 Tax=Curvivirga aplysinae TaxID=2529852 RepID=UPI0012BBB125|nr:adenylate/guanylate cyclase domain-containing protein [Curvivirga aplysinae]MTI09806.1 adenylate/guanylate cyclase domain-containing protein [Curvivirga aplysinae]
MLDIEDTEQFDEISLEHQALLVLGGCEGWSLAHVVDWLISKDSRFTDPALFLKSLCNQLQNAGAPIDRIRLSFRTIHPQVAALSFIWESTKSEIETMQVGHGFKDSAAFIGSPADTLMTTGKPVRFKIEDIDISKEHEAIQDVADTGATDYLALPMLTSTGDVHNLFISTNRKGGFTDCDVQKLKRMAQHIQAKVELLATLRLAIALLDTYVGKRTGQRVLDGQIKRGQGEEIQAALWFSDLRDFTLLTETLPPEDLLELLNEYFELVYNSVTKYGGEVLRFIGDAMLIVFTAENSSTGCLYGASEGAFSASEMAYKELEEINMRRKEEGKPVFNFGVGLHEGTVTYGNVGAPDRLDFTVMGPAVNRTARLESKTKELGRRRLMSREFAEKLSKPIESLGFFNLKGIGEKQEICAVAR